MAITAIGREPGGGLVAIPDSFMTAHRAPVISAAARNKVPAVYWASFFARDGGLLSYGPDLVDINRRAATYVDRILRGAKPAELPVQLPTKYEMVVNLKTAKSLGLTMPQSILLRAAETCDEVAAPNHSITSSARSKIDCGTARPSALAVLRLTTISNLVGNCTGRSPGFAPRRMRST